MITVAESLAIAVMRGDITAAYALADRLIEERDDGLSKMGQIAAEMAQHPVALAGDVWRWPEFRAFCNRAGILIRLRTTGLTIDLDIGKPMRVTHRHIAANGPGAVVDDSTETQ